MKLNFDEFKWEGCMRSTQKKLGIWEQSQHLLKDRRNSKKTFWMHIGF
jgi:hypothetical protein